MPNNYFKLIYDKCSTSPDGGGRTPGSFFPFNDSDKFDTLRAWSEVLTAWTWFEGSDFEGLRVAVYEKLSGKEEWTKCQEIGYLGTVLLKDSSVS